MITKEVAQKILAIEGDTDVDSLSMAKKMRLTFYPTDESVVSANILAFADDLKISLIKLGVSIVPYDKALQYVPVRERLSKSIKIVISNLLYGTKRLAGLKHHTQFIYWSALRSALRREVITPGISVIALGEHKTGKLPMDYTASFKRTTVITVLDRPNEIQDDSNFYTHFETSIKLFAYHMTNLIIAINDNSWILYNFNGSHPTFPIKESLQENVLSALVPKIAAPIRPNKLSEFVIQKVKFDPTTKLYRTLIDDMLESGSLFDKVGIYPQGKTVDDLPFRNNLYRWIGKLHLDHRNGMSYGFLAIQMSTELKQPMTLKQFQENIGTMPPTGWLMHDGKLFIMVNINKDEFIIPIPDIWFLTQRSGSSKTNMDPRADLVKIGLLNGKMYMQLPDGVQFDSGYKPSFDTKIILAHGVGNAIIASISKYLGINSDFVQAVSTRGIALTHWHGYLNEKFVPDGWFVHGANNPHVACSSPQAAIYALQGKLDVFAQTIANKKEFKGDIHIEPHHGSNMTFTSLVNMAKFLLKDKNTTELGNKYLQSYYK